MSDSNSFISFPHMQPGYYHPSKHANRLEASILTRGAVHIKDYWVPRYISDPHWRFYLNLDDGAVIHSNGKRTPLKKMQLYILPGWLRWKSEITQPFRHIFIGARIANLHSVAVQKRWNHVFALPNDDELMQKWVGLMQHCAKHGYQELRTHFQLQQILYRLCELFFTAHPPKDEFIPPQLQEVIEYIDLHLHFDLSNDVLAHQARCSAGHLTRIFSQLLGKSPAQFVRERRISEASHLLSSSDDSIEQISEKLGFPNRYYFTRVFSKETGTSPAAYRKLFR